MRSLNDRKYGSLNTNVQRSENRILQILSLNDRKQGPLKRIAQRPGRGIVKNHRLAIRKRDRSNTIVQRSLKKGSPETIVQQSKKGDRKKKIGQNDRKKFEKKKKKKRPFNVQYQRLERPASTTELAIRAVRLLAINHCNSFGHQPLKNPSMAQWIGRCDEKCQKKDRYFSSLESQEKGLQMGCGNHQLASSAADFLTKVRH